MDDIERHITEFLHGEVEGTEPSPSTYHRVIRRAKLWRWVNASLAGATATAVVAGGVMAAATFGSPATIQAGSGSKPPKPAATEPDMSDCPVTIPPQPGFVPPEPYPSEPPELYRSAWYGEDELWTMLRREGEVWEGLPKDRHGFTQKTFWWTKGYLPEDEPAPPITITGKRLDGEESFVAGAPGTNGMRDDIGSFMLVGLSIPGPGCWELTATYKHSELSYVVWVQE